MFLLLGNPLMYSASPVTCKPFFFLFKIFYRSLYGAKAFHPQHVRSIAVVFVLQDALDEVIFEDYRFQSLLRHWGKRVVPGSLRLLVLVWILLVSAWCL